MKLFRFLDKVEETKDTVSKGFNKNKRSEDEKADIKKSWIWSSINLVLTLAIGIGLFFFFPVLFEMDAGLIAIGCIAIIGIVVGLGTSITKATMFTKDEVVGFGAKLFSYSVVAVIVLMFLLNIFGHLIF